MRHHAAISECTLPTVGRRQRHGSNSMTTGRVRIVTDSLAWLPSELAAEHQIRVVPLHVFFGEEQFTEGVDLTNEEFYRRLQTSKVLPKTSQPSAGEFLNAYREVTDGASAILSVHASSRLSGSVRAAATAANMLREERPDLRVETLDTFQIAMAEGIVALRAAEEASRGVPFDEIVAHARELSSKPRILCALETIEYLYKGGRIGRAQAFVGGLLHVRPIITVIDGEVAPKERVRTRARGMERIVELMGEYAQGRPFGHVGVLHAEAPDAAQEIIARVRERYQVERLVVTEIGPVIGTYVGPGAYGATFHCD